MKKYVKASAELLTASGEIISTSESVHPLNAKIGDIVVPTEIVQSSVIFR